MLSISIQCQSKGMKQNKLTSRRQTSSFERSNICGAHDVSEMATLHAKNAKNCRMESWEVWSRYHVLAFQNLSSRIVLAATSLGRGLRTGQETERLQFVFSCEAGQEFKSVYLDDLLPMEWRQRLTKRKNIFRLFLQNCFIW